MLFVAPIGLQKMESSHLQGRDSTWQPGEQFPGIQVDHVVCMAWKLQVLQCELLQSLAVLEQLSCLAQVTWMARLNFEALDTRGKQLLSRRRAGQTLEGEECKRRGEEGEVEGGQVGQSSRKKLHLVVEGGVGGRAHQSVVGHVEPNRPPVEGELVEVLRPLYHDVQQVALVLNLEVPPLSSLSEQSQQAHQRVKRPTVGFN